MFKSIDRDMRSAFQGRNKRHVGGVSQPAANAQPSTQALFEQIVKEMDRDDIIVIAHPPYVALVVRDEWEVIDACTMNKLCTKAEIFVQRTLLRHARSGQNALVFNCHVPSTAGTERRKKDVVRKLMDLGNEAHGSGVAQPAAAWIVGGDMNLSHSQLVSLCSSFVKPSKPCFSKSGMQRTKDAQKSDIAISRQESQQRARSDDSHLAGGARYTVHEWQQWLSDRELSAEDMQAALALWKARFQVEDMRRETASQGQSAFCIQRAFETRLWPFANGEVLFQVSPSGAEQPCWKHGSNTWLHANIINSAPVSNQAAWLWQIARN